MGWTATWRALGPTSFASYAMARLAAHVPGLSWHRYHLIAIPRVGLPVMPRGHRVRALARHEVIGYASDLDLTRAVIDHRLQQGMTCLGAFRDGRLLGAIWVIAGPFDEDEVYVRFVPPPGAAWDTGLYVRPEDRAGRAFAALWAGIAEWLRAHDLDWAMSRITDANHESWRAHRRLGARLLGTLWALRVGRHQWLPAARPRCVRIDHAKTPLLYLERPDAN